MGELTPENEARMWRKKCGRLNIQLQDEQHKRAFFEQEYHKAVRAIKTLLKIVTDYDKRESN